MAARLYPAAACQLDLKGPVEDRVEAEQQAGGVGRHGTLGRVPVVEAVVATAGIEVALCRNSPMSVRTSNPSGIHRVPVRGARREGRWDRR